MLSEQWIFEDFLGREIAKYQIGSVLAVVEEDDDRAVYQVIRGEEVIAAGGDPSIDESIDAVEAVLIEIGWLYPEDGQVAA